MILFQTVYNMLIYCTDGRKDFEYTYNQRKVETKEKRYRHLMLKDKTESSYSIQSGISENINQIENRLSVFNSKTSDPNKFFAYIREKNIISPCLSYHYNYLGNDKSRLSYRRLRFNTYNNTQRSEANMVNNFRRKFGEPNNTMIIFGDAGAEHIKYKAPVKHKGMRDIFRKAGFKVYLIDEFRTSKLCYKCHCSLEDALKRPSPRPWRDRTLLVNVHGLRRCTTENCQTYVNRDKNAAMNMLRIAKEWIFLRKERHLAFSRQSFG